MGTAGGLVLKLSSRSEFELASKHFENFFVPCSAPAGTHSGEMIAASLVRFREEFPWDLETRAYGVVLCPPVVPTSHLTLARDLGRG